MKTIKLYQPHEDSDTFSIERLFEKEFVTPREQRKMIKTLCNNLNDIEIETLNEYVVACILINCIDNKDINLEIYREDLIKGDYIKIEVDALMFWNDKEIYSNMKNVIEDLSDKRCEMMEK